MGPMTSRRHALAALVHGVGMGPVVAAVFAMALATMTGYPAWAVLLGGLASAAGYALLRRLGPTRPLELDICILGGARPLGAERTSWLSVLQEVATVEAEVRRDGGIEAGSMVVLHGSDPAIVGLPFHFTGTPPVRGTLVRRNEFIRIARPRTVKP